MEFLLKASRESRGKKKLKHLIILCCRALAIAALIFAVARPLATNGFLSLGGKKIDTVLFLLDRSASMEQSSLSNPISKREIALNEIQRAFSKLGNTKLVLIDSATNTPISISTPSTLDDISQTKATDTEANIPALLSTASQYILENDTGKTEIWIASDLRQNDWKPASGSWELALENLKKLSDRISIKLLSLNEKTKDNLWIALTSAQRIEDKLVLDLEINQSDDSSQIETPLTFSFNGAQSSEIINISAGKTKITKQIPLKDASGFGYFQLPTDTNQRDNKAYFSYGAELPMYSAIIAAKSEAEYYFNLAAAPPGYGKQKSKTYNPNQILPWENLSLVIWQEPIPAPIDQKPLLEFINNGGIILFYPPENTKNESFLGNQWGLLNRSSENKYFIVQDWNRMDGPLKNGLDGNSIAVNKLKAIKRRQILSNTSALARWSNGSPFITRSIYGRGAAYFVSTLPDYTWSNLGDAEVILPLTQRLLLKGNMRFNSESITSLGQLSENIKIDADKQKRLDSATQSDPLNIAYEAGVYNFGDQLVALNIPNQENLTSQLDYDALDLTFAGMNFSMFEAKGNQQETFSQPLWQAFLIAMLLFIITEALLCLAPIRKKRESKE